MKKTQFFLYRFVGILLIVIFFCFSAELILRLAGKKPWNPQLANIKVEPDNRWVVKDEKLGYVHAPGKRKMIINNSFSFTATNLNNNLRITHPLDTYGAQNKKDEIWIFGCSFTYGIVNDNETFPWLLQDKILNYKVVNFGQEGFSTLQSLMQFEEAVQKRKIPRVVIIVYASFHDPRNSCLRSFRKTLVPVSHLGPLFYPYARLDRNGNLQTSMSEFVYKEFPLMRHSAFITWLEEQYSIIEDSFIHSHEISKALIKKFYDLCKDYNIKFVVAGIISDPMTQDMLKYCEKKGIMYVDITVDLAKWENTNLPYDNHPNGIANEKYAEKIFSLLRI